VTKKQKTARSPSDAKNYFFRDNFDVQSRKCPVCPTKRYQLIVHNIALDVHPPRSFLFLHENRAMECGAIAFVCSEVVEEIGVFPLPPLHAPSQAWRCSKARKSNSSPLRPSPDRLMLPRGWLLASDIMSGHSEISPKLKTKRPWQ
jgi:hypothetical protein